MKIHQDDQATIDKLRAEHRMLDQINRNDAHKIQALDATIAALKANGV